MPDTSAAKHKLPYILFLCIGLLALLPFLPTTNPEIKDNVTTLRETAKKLLTE